MPQAWAPGSGWGLSALMMWAVPYREPLIIPPGFLSQPSLCSCSSLFNGARAWKFFLENVPVLPGRAQTRGVNHKVCLKTANRMNPRNLKVNKIAFRSMDGPLSYCASFLLCSWWKYLLHYKNHIFWMIFSGFYWKHYCSCFSQKTFWVSPPVKLTPNKYTFEYSDC